MTDVTCALLVVTPDSKILIVHPTGAGYFTSWSLPKGIKDDGEIERDAAARECYEETGLDLRQYASDFIDCGRHQYVTGKDLHMFMYLHSEEINVKLLECTSYFTAHGKQIAEVDRFQAVDIDTAQNLLNKKQYKIVKDSLATITDV